MTRKTKELRGHLFNLINEQQKQDRVIGQLLRVVVERSATAKKTGKDHKWVADAAEQELEKIFQHKDRFQNNDN
jgi:hypothetical protein